MHFVKIGSVVFTLEDTDCWLKIPKIDVPNKITKQNGLL